MSESTDKAESILKEVKNKFGFVPNVLKEMSASPGVLNLYLKGNEFLEESELTEQEKQLVILAVSRYNECEYCQAAHTFIALKSGVDKDDIDGIKQELEPKTPRAKALVLAARLLLNKKGWLTQDNLAELEKRGVNKTQVYEIIGIIGLKTISNYINHVAGTEIDEVFK